MKFSDSHFHSLSLTTSLDDVYSALSVGIDISTRPDDTEKILDNIKGHDNIYTTIAAGPWCAEDDNRQTFIRLKELLGKYRHCQQIIAIGEVGLDYYHSDYASAEKQKELFSYQLALADEYKLPFILHIRESFDDVKKCLNGFYGQSGFQNIVHCFSGNTEDAKAFLDMGFYLAFGGNVTYKSNGAIREALKITPLDRLLVETDSPYLSPQGKRGEENTPLNIPIIIDAVSNIRQESAESIAEATCKNLKSFVSQKCK